MVCFFFVGGHYACESKLWQNYINIRGKDLRSLLHDNCQAFSVDIVHRLFLVVNINYHINRNNIYSPQMTFFARTKKTTTNLYAFELVDSPVALFSVDQFSVTTA